MSVSAIEPPDDLAGVASPGSGFGHVLGIPVTVDVLLGSTTMLVADLMKLGRGAILPLDGKVGDHVTIAVNGRAVARGEIVVLEDEDFRLGVSLTEVMGSASSSSGA